MLRLALTAFLLSACGPEAIAPATGVPTATLGEGVRSASPVAPTASPARASLPSPFSEGTPPPLTRMEVKVIDALAALGVAGLRAQHPGPWDASIWANFGAGQHFFVHAGPTWTRAREASFAVLDERRIDGIRVQHAQYESGLSTHHRFECADDTYSVSGALPPGSRDMYAFVARFIRALSCAA